MRGTGLVDARVVEVGRAWVANMPEGGDRACLLGKLQAETIVQSSSSYSYENPAEADLTPGPA